MNPSSAVMRNQILTVATDFRFSLRWLWKSEGHSSLFSKAWLPLLRWTLIDVADERIIFIFRVSHNGRSQICKSEMGCCLLVCYFDLTFTLQSGYRNLQNIGNLRDCTLSRRKTSKGARPTKQCSMLRIPSSGMWSRVNLVGKDVSEVFTNTIIHPRRVLQLLVTVNVVPNSLIFALSWWRWHFPPKHRFSQQPHSLTFQKTTLIKVISPKVLDLTYSLFCSAFRKYS
jgi:hypothetical protein